MVILTNRLNASEIFVVSSCVLHPAAEISSYILAKPSVVRMMRATDDSASDVVDDVQTVTVEVIIY
jgi:hypothetical protein